MSDRALLEELLEYVLSDNYKNLFYHFLDVRKKAKEIRTRMTVEKTCDNCQDHMTYAFWKPCLYCIRNPKSDHNQLFKDNWKEQKDGN